MISLKKIFSNVRMSVVTYNCRNGENTNDGQSNLPSIVAGSLQAINCKFGNIRDVCYAMIDKG